ncbi:hypothetical protein C8R45DRAFT_1043963, partial [Mycena sanguinolenta]
MVGSMMDFFWAYKSGEPLAEVSNFTPFHLPTPTSFPTTPTSSNMSTSYKVNTPIGETIFYNLPSDADLRPEFVRFNKEHSAIKRISTTHFVFLVPGMKDEILPAALVRLFADFNIMLIMGEGIPPNIPAYYNYYARALNEHDKSISGWCVLEQGTHATRLVYPDLLVPADAGAFYVRDHEIVDRYLAPDMVPVTTIYYDNAERLAQDELRRNVRWAKQRQEKRLLGKSKGLAVLDSQEAKAKFAVKRKALEAAAAAAEREAATPEEGEVPDVPMVPT